MSSTSIRGLGSFWFPKGIERALAMCISCTSNKKKIEEQGPVRTNLDHLFTLARFENNSIVAATDDELESMFFTARNIVDVGVVYEFR